MEIDFAKYFFSASIQMICSFYSLTLLIYVADFQMLNQHYTYLVLMHNPLHICCWGFFAMNLLMIFFSIQRVLIVVFFSCDVFVWPWYQSNSGFIEWVGKFSLLFIFWGKRFHINSCLSIWYCFTSEAMFCWTFGNF